MLQLLLYLFQLLPLLVSLGLLIVLCGGKKQRKSNCQNVVTGRSNVSTKSVQTGGSKSTGEMLKTCVDSGVGGGRLQLGGEESNDRGTTTENKSGRISIHGAIHNTDTRTFASAEQIDGDAKMPSVEIGIDQEKAAPGKVSLTSVDDKDKKNEKSLTKEKSLQKEKEQQTQEISNMDIKSMAKNSLKTPNEDQTQKTEMTV
uniref:Uncharacterized protein n=1 Tax=Pristionchus pacificus TaxID=54126 RepID=A0A2A6BJ49_PRIPA|eukprot:PDM65922.1 hypothetical protein PRIPAC_44201 [Pristionchus pacificus]